MLKEKKRTVYAGSRGLWEVLGRPVVSRPLKRGLDGRGGGGGTLVLHDGMLGIAGGGSSLYASGHRMAPCVLLNLHMQ